MWKLASSLDGLFLTFHRPAGPWLHSEAEIRLSVDLPGRADEEGERSSVMCGLSQCLSWLHRRMWLTSELFTIIAELLWRSLSSHSSWKLYVSLCRNGIYWLKRHISLKLFPNLLCCPLNYFTFWNLPELQNVLIIVHLSWLHWISQLHTYDKSVASAALQCLHKIWVSDEASDTL